MRKCNLNQVPCREACGNFVVFASPRSPAHRCSRFAFSISLFPLQPCRATRRLITSSSSQRPQLRFSSFPVFLRTPPQLPLYAPKLNPYPKSVIKSREMTEFVHRRNSLGRVSQGTTEPETEGGGPCCTTRVSSYRRVTYRMTAPTTSSVLPALAWPRESRCRCCSCCFVQSCSTEILSASAEFKACRSAWPRKCVHCCT